MIQSVYLQKHWIERTQGMGSNCAKIYFADYNEYNNFQGSRQQTTVVIENKDNYSESMFEKIMKDVKSEAFSIQYNRDFISYR